MFQLLANEGVRQFEQSMFNDQILEFCLVYSIYLLACKSRPVVASLILTFAVSLKASGLLLAPTMLGMIQYHYGIVTLLKSIAVFITWQYLVAGMFYHEFAGGETGLEFYLKLARFKESDVPADNRGATW